MYLRCNDRQKLFSHGAYGSSYSFYSSWRFQPRHIICLGFLLRKKLKVPGNGGGYEKNFVPNLQNPDFLRYFGNSSDNYPIDPTEFSFFPLSPLTFELPDDRSALYSSSSGILNFKYHKNETDNCYSGNGYFSQCSFYLLYSNKGRMQDDAGVCGIRQPINL